MKWVIPPQNILRSIDLDAFPNLIRIPGRSVCYAMISRSEGSGSSSIGGHPTTLLSDTTPRRFFICNECSPGLVKLFTDFLIEQRKNLKQQFHHLESARAQFKNLVPDVTVLKETRLFLALELKLQLPSAVQSFRKTPF